MDLVNFDQAKEIRKHPLGRGVQRLYAYDNGYGASVIQIDSSQENSTYKDFKKKKGAWEFAMFKWKSAFKEGEQLITHPIVYAPKTNLTTQEVDELLGKLKGKQDEEKAIKKLYLRTTPAKGDFRNDN